MSQSAIAQEEPTAKRSVLNYLSLLCLTVGSAFLTAAVVLIYQYKLGIPFSMAISILIAAAAALCVPMLVTIIAKRWATYFNYPGHVAFLLSNLTISIVLGILIF